MRKLFSLITAVLFAGSMMAAETVVFSEQGYENGQAIETYAGTEFTITFDKGTNNNAPKYYNTGAAIRCYGGNSFTVTSEKDITKIELAFAEGESTNAILTDVEAYADGVWAGKAKAIKFTIDGTSGHRRIASVAVTFDGEGGEEEDPDEIVIYDWAGNIGTTLLGTTGVEVSTVKIHTNTDVVSAIKFGSSYVYAEGKYIAIKPAEGGFKAGDVLYMAAVFSNSDDTKYAQVDLRAADGDTRIWLSDSASTINGRTSAADPIVQTYKLEADQDSLFLGRYGNTGMFIVQLLVGRPEAPEPEKLTFDFKVDKEGITITPSNNDPWAGMALPTAVITEDFGTIEALVEAVKDIMEPIQGKYTLKFEDLDPEEFPAGTECTFVAWGLVEGVVTAIGSTEFVVPAPLADPTNCAEAAAAALSVSENNELYNGGKEYTIEGYVTEIATAWNSQYSNISFWMADEKDGGQVLQAFRAACASAEDAARVGDKVKVTGALTKYNTTPEFAAGCTVEIIERAPAYYVVGSMTGWEVKAEYQLAPKGLEYVGEFTFAKDDEFKVVKNQKETWYPDGMDNNYKITEAGGYTIRFKPEGGVEGWYEGYFIVEPKTVDTITCAKAAEDALAGETYEAYVKGYVTEIAYAWKDQSMSFWMADEKDGSNVFEAYKCAIEKEEDAVRVGDLVVAHGNLTKYNSTPELAAGCTVEILERAPEVVPQNLGEKTIAEFLELKNKIDTCILTGAIDSVVNTNYGNFYLKDETGTVYVYGLKDAEGNNCFEPQGLAKGDIITILAVYSEFNSAPQVKNAIFVRKKGQGLDNTGVETKVEKFFRNGQLIIRKNGVEYNAQGARVL